MYDQMEQVKELTKNIRHVPDLEDRILFLTNDGYVWFFCDNFFF